jgi:hypothetical protein
LYTLERATGASDTGDSTAAARTPTNMIFITYAQLCGMLFRQLH